MVEEIKTTKLIQRLIAPNDRNIALMYFIFGSITVFVGFSFSLFIRMELQEPGIQILSEGRVYNILTTSHGLILTVFSLIPLLFCGFGHLILSNELRRRETIFKILGIVAFVLLIIAFSLFSLDIYLSLNFLIVNKGTGWTIYPPFSNEPSSGPVIIFGAWSLFLAMVSFFITSTNFLMMFIVSKTNGIKFSNIPASCWAFLIAALLIMTLSIGYLVFDNIFRLFLPFEILNIDKFRIILHSILLLATFAVLCAGISAATSWAIKDQSIVIITIIVSGFSLIAIRVSEIQLSTANNSWIYTFVISDFVIIFLLIVFSLSLFKLIRFKKTNLTIPLGWIIVTVLMMLFSYGVCYFIFFKHGIEFLHDTYFYVAMEHLTIKIPAMFAFFAGWYAFFSKITGRSYFPILSILHLVSFSLGSLLTFAPQIQLGILGMPKRYIDYPNVFADLNLLSSIGSYIAFASLIFFVLALIFTKKQETNAQA